jgi:hypothetical protein
MKYKRVHVDAGGCCKNYTISKPSLDQILTVPLSYKINAYNIPNQLGP